MERGANGPTDRWFLRIGSCIYNWRFDHARRTLLVNGRFPQNTFDFQGNRYRTGQRYRSRQTLLDFYQAWARPAEIWPVGSKSISLHQVLPTTSRLIPHSNVWSDTGTGSFTQKIWCMSYSTGTKVVERCILQSRSPGDLRGSTQPAASGHHQPQLQSNGGAGGSPSTHPRVAFGTGPHAA